MQKTIQYEKQRTGLGIMMEILTAVRFAPKRKFRVMITCGIAYNNPRWLEAIARGLVSEEKPPHHKTIVKLTEKGRKSLELYEALIKQLDE